MKTVISKRFSIEQCRTNPKTLFIFGDNTKRIGTGGQAQIREQVNAIGLVTKNAPGADKVDYFTDDSYEENCKLIDEDIQRIIEYAADNDFKEYGFPQMGLGTGLSDMPRKCPKTFCYLTVRLLEEFQFNNIEFLISKPV